MTKQKDIITLSCGSGGGAMQNLIRDFFIKKFGNQILNKLEDAAELNIPKSRIAFTTDSFVVKPLFFPGGDIGRLAVCGTVNDLSVKGACPKALSAGFIIEEGFERKKLEKIIDSMQEALKEAGVSIVTGDTKVVEKGSADGVFINTAGIGAIGEDVSISSANAQAGDIVIVSGSLGDHSACIMKTRNNFGFSTEILSDCCPLNGIIKNILDKNKKDIHVMRDPTRGGIATALSEISEDSNVDIEIFEDKLPIKEEVKNLSEILGIDPLYLANEGKFIVIAEADKADDILSIMKSHTYGKDACVIGKVVNGNGKTYSRTLLGTKRNIPVLQGDPLPRIC